MAEPKILKFRFKKNYITVVKDLEPRKVLGYLYQEDIIDEDDMDEVRDERTRKKQAEALLSMLKLKGENGYAVLVDALSETQPHLARLLQTPVPEETNEIVGMYEKLRCGPTENDVTAPVSPTGTTGYISASYVDSGVGSGTGHPTIAQQDSTAFVKPTDLNLISPLYRPNAQKHESVYKMTSSPRGLAIIINNNVFEPNQTFTGEELVNRDGSEVDEESLVKLFNALDFKTQTLINLGEKELLTSLEKIAKSDFSDYDCFVLCIMSHGKEGFFYTSDGGKIRIKQVIQKFNNANCKTLCGKPKLYFIQACRGKDADSGIIMKDGPCGNPTEHEEPQKQSTEKLPEKPEFVFEIKRGKTPSTSEQADQLLAFSSVEGYSSYRNTSSGSRFIRCLVEVFREYAGKEDVESMMTRVIRKVNSQGDLGSKQVPKPETTLTKKVFFWPGMTF